MIKNVLNAFLEWAKEAINWVLGFILVALGVIVSWLAGLTDIISDWLDVGEENESVIIDPNKELGKEILKVLDQKGTKPQSFDAYKKEMEVLEFKKDGTINKVRRVGAESVKERNKFDQDLEDNDGVLRFKK
ncbi:MAG: hypothetical protein II981_06505 [Bacteroidales bacterium]|nr:hypothetical protein [Bacteroidales bacterium]